MSLAQSAAFLFSCPISIVIRVLLIEVIVASGQWARRCDTEFFEKKNCKGKIGSTRKRYEVKWSGSVK